MQENTQINSLVMKAVVALVPIFVVPALLAVVIIKHYNLKGALALLPIVGALSISWLFVLRLQMWGRNSVRNIIRK